MRLKYLRRLYRPSKLAVSIEGLSTTSELLTSLSMEFHLHISRCLLRMNPRIFDRIP